MNLIVDNWDKIGFGGALTVLLFYIVRKSAHTIEAMSARSSHTIEVLSSRFERILSELSGIHREDRNKWFEENRTERTELVGLVSEFREALAAHDDAARALIRVAEKCHDYGGPPHAKKAEHH